MLKRGEYVDRARAHLEEAEIVQSSIYNTSDGSASSELINLRNREVMTLVQLAALNLQFAEASVAVHNA